MPENGSLVTGTARGGKKRLPEAKVTAPPIHDTTKFVKRADAPIFDEHQSEGEKGSVSLEDLQELIDNTNKRIQEGMYPLLQIGHIDEDKPEHEQPIPVGVIGETRLGTFHGRPCMLADLYYDRDHLDEAKTFPFPSVERIYNPTNPDRNFIAAVALLRRLPERPMGYMMYSRDTNAKAGEKLMRYAFAGSLDGADSQPPPKTPRGKTMPMPGMPMAPAPAKEHEEEESPEALSKLEKMVEKILRKFLGEAEEEKHHDEEDEHLDDEEIGQVEEAEHDEGDEMHAHGMMHEDGDGDEEEMEQNNFAQAGPTNTFIPKRNAEGGDHMEKNRHKGKENRTQYAATPRNLGKPSTNGNGGDVLLKYQAEVSNLRKENGRLKADLTQTKTKLASIEDSTTELMIKYRMDQATNVINTLMGEGIVLEPEKAAKDFLALPQERWADKIDEIRLYYRKTPVGMPGVPVARNASNAGGQVAAADHESFIQFCSTNRITDVAVGRARWAAFKAQQAV